MARGPTTHRSPDAPLRKPVLRTVCRTVGPRQIAAGGGHARGAAAPCRSDETYARGAAAARYAHREARALGATAWAGGVHMDRWHRGRPTARAGERLLQARRGAAIVARVRGAGAGGDAQQGDGGAGRGARAVARYDARARTAARRKRRLRNAHAPRGGSAAGCQGSLRKDCRCRRVAVQSRGSEWRERGWRERRRREERGRAAGRCMAAD
mmetsp:Transcript_21920/g.47872  ORF Transcript_21920/g.47872 Transcript_21920/m.47872 type:complete len:211 (+) Transcript_21920:1648-2280(+)